MHSAVAGTSLLHYGACTRAGCQAMMVPPWFAACACSLLQEAILAARLQHLLRISLPNFFRAHAVLKADLQAFKAELKASKASALASKTSWDANKASLDRLRSRMYRLDKRLERLREKAPRLEKDVVRTGCNLARMVAKREGGSEGVVQPQHPDLAER